MIEEKKYPVKKILYIGPYPPQKNGIADYAWSFKQHLEEAGFKVTLFRGNEKKWMIFSVRTFLREYRMFYRIIKRGNYDIIHIESGGSLGREFFLMAFASIVKGASKLAITVHDPPTLIDLRFLGKFFLGIKRFQGIGRILLSPLLFIPRAFFLDFMLRPIRLVLHLLIYRRADNFFVLTVRGLVSINELYRVGWKVSVIPHGKLEYKGQTSKTDNLFLGKKPDKTLIGMIGFIAPSKGIEIFLEALQHIVIARPDLINLLEVWICGGVASGGDMVYLEYIANIVGVFKRRYGMDINMKGHIPDKAMNNLLSRIDILVITARRIKIFPTSGSLIRGMAAGKAVVVSNVRGYADEIIHGKTGLLFNEDSRHLANQLVMLLDNPSLRNELGKNAMAHIEQEHSWPKIMQVVSEAYGKSGVKDTRNTKENFTP
jgi:glycosyltransferase involved in cell wall biosynthesis